MPSLPTARAPLTTENFVTDVLPLVSCYFATSLLVLFPRTQLIRVALCPITVFLAFRASTSLDMSMGQPKLQFLNAALQLFMFCLVARTLEWTAQTKPFFRRDPGQRSPSNAPIRKSVLDALDLACTFRGCGWDWSRGLHVTPAKRDTYSRPHFAAASLVTALVHAFLCGVLHSAVQSFSPHTFGSVHGGTIFDDSLPPHLRYLRSSIIVGLSINVLYCVLQTAFEFTAALCVMLLRHRPDQWPILFDAPWDADSLRDHWSRRWQQLFRQPLLFLGGRPLSRLFGRRGRIMGTFLTSGLLHHLPLLALDPSSEMWRMMLPFAMLGLGMILERDLTRNNARGTMGWVWSTGWMLLWMNVVVEGWARCGLLGGFTFVDGVSPVRKPVELLVGMFDDYLHMR